MTSVSVTRACFVCNRYACAVLAQYSNDCWSVGAIIILSLTIETHGGVGPQDYSSTYGAYFHGNSAAVVLWILAIAAAEMIGSDRTNSKWTCNR